MNKYVIVRLNTDIKLGDELYEDIEEKILNNPYILEAEVVKGSENYRDLITGKGESY